VSYETYRAKSARRAAAGQGLAAAAVAATEFSIDVRFMGGLTTSQQDAFKFAADRWCTVIIEKLPSVVIDGEVIQNVLILAQGSEIDGAGRILGQAGPTHLRPASAAAAAFIPAKGEMAFDTADLEDMEERGTLKDVITHEMGHVLGIGTIWTRKKLLKGTNTANPTFAGPNAMNEYGVLVGGTPKRVPVENTGGAGTANSHWRDMVFGNELMTGFVADAPNPLSRMTVASLEDLGYSVDVAAAEPYSLPTPHALAEAGVLAAHAAEESRGIVLPRIPFVLPDESLQP
jgi:hypothetical protein